MRRGNRSELVRGVRRKNFGTAAVFGHGRHSFNRHDERLRTGHCGWFRYAFFSVLRRRSRNVLLLGKYFYRDLHDVFGAARYLQKFFKDANNNPCIGFDSDNLKRSNWEISILHGSCTSPQRNSNALRDDFCA